MNYRVWILSTNLLMDLNPGTFGAPSRYSLCSTMLSFIRFTSSKYSIANPRTLHPTQSKQKDSGRIGVLTEVLHSSCFCMPMTTSENQMQIFGSKSVPNINTFCGTVAILNSDKYVQRRLSPSWYSPMFQAHPIPHKILSNQARTTEIIGENGRHAIIGHGLSGLHMEMK